MRQITSLKFTCFVAAALCLSAVVQTAQAGVIPADNGQPIASLDELLGGGEIVNGDKRFAEFTYGASGDMPPADRVNVFRIIDDHGNLGLRFQGAFIDIDSTDNDASDALITYTVEALDPNMLITDAHIFGNPNVLGDADTGSISVTETFLPPSLANFTGEIFDDPAGAGLQRLDWVIFDEPVRSLQVFKDIAARAGEGTATLSFVDQTFSQIPEPSTVTLMMVGLAGIAFAGRRKR